MEEDKKDFGKMVGKLDTLFQETQLNCRDLANSSSNQELAIKALKACNGCVKFLDYPEKNFDYMRKFLDGKFYEFLNIVKEVFVKMIMFDQVDIFSLEKWAAKEPETLFFANLLSIIERQKVTDSASGMRVFKR